MSSTATRLALRAPRTRSSGCLGHNACQSIRMDGWAAVRSLSVLLWWSSIVEVDAVARADDLGIICVHSPNRRPHLRNMLHGYASACAHAESHGARGGHVLSYARRDVSPLDRAAAVAVVVVLGVCAGPAPSSFHVAPSRSLLCHTDKPSLACSKDARHATRARRTTASRRCPLACPRGFAAFYLSDIIIVESTSSRYNCGYM